MQHVSKWSQTQISVVAEIMEQIVDATPVPVPLEMIAAFRLFVETAVPAILLAGEVDHYDA